MDSRIQNSTVTAHSWVQTLKTVAMIRKSFIITKTGCLKATFSGRTLFSVSQGVFQICFDFFSGRSVSLNLNSLAINKKDDLG